MALRSYASTGFTPTGVADSPTALVSGNYMALQGGNSTQRFRIEEIYLGGQAGASQVNNIILARDVVIGATLSNSATATDTVLDAAANALAVVVASFNTATTAPQRSTTLKLLSLSFNAFGGVVRWVTSPNEYGPTGFGNAINTGEMSLSGGTVGTAGAMSAHIIYEPF